MENLTFDNWTSTPELRQAIADAVATKHFPYKEFTRAWFREKLKIRELGHYSRPVDNQLQSKYLRELKLRDYPDNHEAFLVENAGTNYYVHFSDSTVYIYG